MKLSEMLGVADAPALAAPSSGPKTKLSGKLVEEHGMPTGRNSRVFARQWAEDGVQHGPESRRIFALPRREWPAAKAEATARQMTHQYRMPGGTMELRPLQAIALWEAKEQGGLVAPLPVGEGKTLVALLLPLVMRAKKTVLLVPPRLRNQLEGHDISYYDRHFRLSYLEDKSAAQLHVVAYSTLSIERGQDELERIGPDLIVADECHMLRHKDSTRTKRFLRYFKQHPNTRFCGLSGTMTSRSLRDFAHLSELALRKNSPVPGSFQELSDWSDALDVVSGDFNEKEPGILFELATDEERQQLEPRAAARVGFRRRLVDTAGVVTSQSEGSIGTALYIHQRQPAISENLERALDDVRESWQRPDGEEIADPLELARVLKQLACGFYYRWVWPGGIVDWEWLQARAAWHREVREKLKRAQSGLDSPLLLAKSATHSLECVNKKCGRPHWKSDTWSAWALAKERPQPLTEAVWVDESIVTDIVELARDEEDGPAIVWYEYQAIGEKISELGKFPLLEGGDEADHRLVDLSKKPVTVAASLKAHGQGKNLQAWSRMIFAGCPGSGQVWEQALGRCHRQGQEADQVVAHVYLHTDELCGAWLQARRDAKYVADTSGSRQKLLYASSTFNKEKKNGY